MFTYLKLEVSLTAWEVKVTSKCINPTYLYVDWILDRHRLTMDGSTLSPLDRLGACMCPPNIYTNTILSSVDWIPDTDTWTVALLSPLSSLGGNEEELEDTQAQQH